MKPGLIDETFPCIPAIIAQRNGAAARNALQRIAFGIAESIHDGIVRIADRRAQPDIAVFVLELDVIAVSVTKNTSLALFFFQVEKAARELLPFAKLGVDHDGRGYCRIQYETNGLGRR